MFFEKKLKAQTLISSHFYNSKIISPNQIIAENKHLDKLHTNAKIEDEGLMFGKSGEALGDT